jgi:hypothetical protein
MGRSTSVLELINVEIPMLSLESGLKSSTNSPFKAILALPFLAMNFELNTLPC